MAPTYQIWNTYEGPDEGLVKDVAFNRRDWELAGHKSPFDLGEILVGLSDIKVVLTQPIQEDQFRKTLSRAINATTGVDLDNPPDEGDWEEMMKGGLQTALETQVIVFEVQGVSRTATHQIVRSRRAGFHQQSQRASDMGMRPNVRMPASVAAIDEVKSQWKQAIEDCMYGYNLALRRGVSFQDARFILPEGTCTYIMCEYPVREFLNLYAYRACSMFQWEICHTVREMGRRLIEAHPWIAPYVKISCELTHGAKDANNPEVLKDFAKTPGMFEHTCTFQGWEEVEGQCDFPWARESNRQFKSERHSIAKLKSDGPPAAA